MDKNLLKAEDYVLFTFSSTSHALKAEKVLKNHGADFIVIPTLREISTSCGLSVKAVPQDLDRIYSNLTENKVSIEGIFRVVKEGKKNRVTRVEI